MPGGGSRASCTALTVPAGTRRNSSIRPVPPVSFVMCHAERGGDSLPGLGEEYCWPVAPDRLRKLRVCVRMVFGLVHRLNLMRVLHSFCGAAADVFSRPGLCGTATAPPVVQYSSLQRLQVSMELVGLLLESLLETFHSITSKLLHTLVWF